TIPSFTITGVDVKESADKYVISKDKYSETVNGVEYSGSIEGTITGGGAEISFTVKPGAMPMDISYTFNGYSYSSQFTKLK
ncbi:MAG: calycin-like domain-containing protein, partial [Muribaculaceae bacterium]|nr:calycin-like domain-containing protein [Muribaculaceae bacterium]